MPLKNILKKIFLAAGVAACIAFPSKAYAFDTSQAETITSESLEIKLEDENKEIILEISSLTKQDNRIKWLESMNPFYTDTERFKTDVTEMFEDLKPSIVLSLSDRVSVATTPSGQKYDANLYFKSKRTTAVLDLLSFKDFVSGDGSANLSFQHQFSDKLSTRGRMSFGNSTTINLDTSFKISKKDNLNLQTILKQGKLDSYRLQGNVSTFNLDYVYNSTSYGKELDLHTLRKIGNLNLEAAYKHFSGNQDYDSYRIDLRPDGNFSISFFKTEFSEKTETALVFNPRYNLSLTASLGQEKIYGLRCSYGKKNIILDTNLTYSEDKGFYPEIRFGLNKEF